MNPQQLSLTDYKPEPLPPWWFRKWFKTDECREILDNPRKIKNEQKLSNSN